MEREEALTLQGKFRNLWRSLASIIAIGAKNSETRMVPFSFFGLVSYLFYYLNNEYKPILFTDRCIQRPEEKHRDHRNLDISIGTIREEIQNTDRHNQIAVVVVDYAMPNINGLDFCRQLKNKNVIVILLTGEADNDLAVKAFNEGLIHKFLLKSTTDVADKLLKLIHEHNIAEYYLIDDKGSFLFLNEDNKKSYLAVKDEEAMAADLFDAEMSNEEVDKSIVEALSSREKLLFIISEAGQKLQPADWNSCLYTANKLAGKNLYYYNYPVI